MNSIEDGPPYEPTPGEAQPGSDDHGKAGTTHSAAEPHIFARLPSTGVPEAVARHWAGADSRAVRRLSDPIDREIAFNFMARNMGDNRHYADALDKRAPKLVRELRTLARRDLPQPGGSAGPDAASKLPHEPGLGAGVPEPLRPDQEAPDPRQTDLFDRDRPQPDLSKRDGDQAFELPERLRKRYLIAENKYYFRNPANDLAFEDAGKRLSTRHDDPDVAISMVELAQAKRWTSIKLKGSVEFKREAWLAAALRGIDVTGYKPDKLDLARFEDQRAREQARAVNAIERSVPREHALPHEERAAGPDKGAQQRAGHDPSQDGATAPDTGHSVSAERAARRPAALLPQQQTAIDALKAILRQRGDPQRVIDMAAALAAERFTHPRVYVGKLVEHGPAHFEFDPENEPSYYVKLETGAGAQTVWGVDLPRALDTAQARPGQDIALAYQGMRPVVVNTRELDAAGKPTGRLAPTEVERNTWEVTPLHRLQDQAKRRLIAAAARSGQARTLEPVVNVYDYAAPRQPQRESAPVLESSRQRGPERRPGR